MYNRFGNVGSVFPKIVFLFQDRKNIVAEFHIIELLGFSSANQKK